LIDFLFTSISLSHGDDARPVIARRMGYDNQTPSQQAQSDEPFFAVSKTVVFEGDARPCKHLPGILKAGGRAWRRSSGSSPRPIRISFHLKPIVLLFVVTIKLSRKLVVANHLIDSITDRFFCLPAIPTWTGTFSRR
jgi:hypothetical protein